MKAFTTVSLVFSALAIRASADQCAATLTPSCAWLCPVNGDASSATEWKCAEKTDNTCLVCSIYNACPATFDKECPYYCGYPKYPLQPGFCSYVNVSTQGSVCQLCPGASTNGSTSTAPTPPVATGAASTLQISGLAIGGLLAALFASL
ncbi:hypothetical protein Dda_5951 [Drechslerella dactyloides]|uniref:Uncharacterized protein n=1 Tax=Drechslerella dactyloides TaxID=74499 RepID=A0AAD6IW55_DREDA|nr:hypothetical protein Dda_5951 [Drechslerella dactyloides]